MTYAGNTPKETAPMLAPTHPPKSWKRAVLELCTLVLCTLLLWFVLGYVRFGADAHAITPLVQWCTAALFGILGCLWIASPWVASFFHKKALIKAERKSRQASDPSAAAFSAQVKRQHHFHDTCQRLKRIGMSSERQTASGWQSCLNYFRPHNPLYMQPWFLVLGQSKVGKTQLLNQAGAQPITPPLENTVNWYHASKALFLEAPSFSSADGRAHAMDAQNDATLLGCTLGKGLKKYRPQHPLNGIILVISAQSLWADDQKPLQQLASQTQQTLAALMQQTGAHVPVQIVISQMDVLPGFQEYHAGCSAAERALGSGFALNHATANPLHQCAAQLDQLEDALLQNLVTALHHAQHTSTCAQVQNFPVTFSRLRQNLQKFLGTLITQTTPQAGNTLYKAQTHSTIPPHGTITLQGLYFTSAQSCENAFFIQGTSKNPH